jgi:hypothetical protein
MSYNREQAAQFAGFIKGLGFTVYMAEQGHYGFITDETESRVMCFQFGVPNRLSGNYGPPSRESGTGWHLSKDPSDLKTAQDVREALYETPPPFAGRGWKHFTTVEQHLAAYNSSSKYTKL